MRRNLICFFLLILLFSGVGAARTDSVMEKTLLPLSDELYLPLRPVTEFFGLPLHWNAIEKKAYIGNRGIEGELFAGTFYVPVVELAIAINGDLNWFPERGAGFLRYQNLSIDLQLPRPPEKENPPLVHLTFDDGPNEGTPYILDVLDAYNIKGTFFLVGENILKNPGVAKRIVAQGHQVGNHSFTHSLMPNLSSRAMRHELELTQNAFRVIMGVDPVLFRPPYGGWSPELRDIYHEMGLQLAWWTIDTQDFNKPGARVMVDQILREIEPGAVILFHCKLSTANALPDIINAVWEKGYDFRILLEK